MERFGPISIKYVLKCFAMTSVSVTILLFAMICCGKKFLKFFVSPMESLITSQVRFRLFLYFIIKFEQYNIFDRDVTDSKKFLKFLYSDSLPLFRFFKNFLLRRYFFLEDFLIPVVIQQLFKSFFEIFIFFPGKK